MDSNDPNSGAVALAFVLAKYIGEPLRIMPEGPQKEGAKLFLAMLADFAACIGTGAPAGEAEDLYAKYVSELDRVTWQPPDVDAPIPYRLADVDEDVEH